MTSGDVPILVSACLAGIPCRYDGRAKPDPQIIDAVARGSAIPACAEQLGGMSTPRPPAEIVGGDGTDVLDGRARVVTTDGDDVTEEFVRGAHQVLEIARRARAQQAVLQARSPSCGCGEIYDGTHSGARVAGDGVVSALLKRHDIEVDARQGQRPSP